VSLPLADSRLWLNDGSCIRLRAERPNHVWSYDFLEVRTPMMDANFACSTSSTSSPTFAWPSVSRRLKPIDVLDVLSDLFILRGIPDMAVSSRGENDNRVPAENAVREPQNRRDEITF
jgi:putative transposase